MSESNGLRRETASQIRDVQRRIGPGCTREWIREQLDRIANQLEFHANLSEPVKSLDMVLPCPRCGTLHIDAPEPNGDWTNPPHKSHLCHSCGLIWRPADVATNGVVSVKTRGDKDSPADDGEAVTEEWLLAEGWTPGFHNGNQNRWEKTICVQEHDQGGSTRHWLVIHRTDDVQDFCETQWWPIEFRQQHSTDDKPDGVALLTWVMHTTRGHVRRLITALNITPVK